MISQWRWRTRSREITTARHFPIPTGGGLLSVWLEQPTSLLLFCCCCYLLLDHCPQSSMPKQSTRGPETGENGKINWPRSGLRSTFAKLSRCRAFSCALLRSKSSRVALSQRTEHGSVSAGKAVAVRAARRVLDTRSQPSIVRLRLVLRPPIQQSKHEG